MSQGGATILSGGSLNISSGGGSVSATVDGKLLLDSRKDPRGALGVRMLDKKGRPLEGKYLLKKEGYYEARIPRSALPDDARELKLTWVDFYRG